MIIRGLIHLTQVTGRRVYHALKIADLRSGQLSEAAEKRMRRTQLRGVIDQMRVFVVGNSLFAPVLAYQAWDKGLNAIVICWTAAMLLFSWWLLFSWSKTYQTDGRASDMQKFVAETRVNASLWCGSVFFFYPQVTGDNKTILTVIMVGSLALGTVGFSQAPRAAFWYLGIQTCVLSAAPLFHGLTRGSGSDIMIGMLALFSGVAIANAVLERARAQMLAFINHEKLAQKSEVIDLLLKDYEEQGFEWLWQTDAEGNLQSGPRPVLDLLEISTPMDTAVDLIAAIKGHIDADGALDAKRVSDAFANRIDFHNVMLPFNEPSTGQQKYIMMRGRPQFDGDTYIGFRGIFADATTTVVAQKQVEFLADHDPLTGAFNRNVLQRQLERLDADTARAVAFLIDLDGFKQVNDSYGHIVGDLLLQQVTERLHAIVSPDQMVARLGGDEFLVLVNQPKDAQCFQHLAFADGLLDELSKPYQIQQFEIALSASIGITTFPDDTSIGVDLLTGADLALYAAKRNGRNQKYSFVEGMRVSLNERITVTEQLKLAIAAKQITPFYQPQHCAITGQLVGVEALARWHDPKLGQVSPETFIPIAEETGLIHKLGVQILLAACRDAVDWGNHTICGPPIVSVNLSPAQVTRGDIVDVVKNALSETGLPAHRLEIEITEGILIHDIEATCTILRELSELGVMIALDDFGTGYSSLSYIRALPLDRLKIDRSFVECLDDPGAGTIVQTIIDLCASLGLSVVAEGVETEAHAQTLGAMRCDVLQGYYFSPAVTGAEILKMITAQDAKNAQAQQTQA